MKGFRFHGKDICINGKSIQKLCKIFFSSYILFDDNNRCNSHLHRPVFPLPQTLVRIEGSPYRQGIPMYRVFAEF